MKKFAAFSSLLMLGTVGFLVVSYLNPGEIQLDLSDEDIHLYL